MIGPPTKEFRMPDAHKPEDPQAKQAVPHIPEMVGATTGSFLIGAGETQVAFRLHAPSGPGRDRSAGSEEIFLRIENVTCNQTAPNFTVFLNVPAGAKTADHPDLFAGSMGMFGLPMASNPRSEHGGTGLNFVLDVTDLFHRLRSHGVWNAEQLQVTFAPSYWGAPVPQVKVGRVSLYVQ
jgi:tyrosinase